MAEIEFLYDFGSPNAYLAHKALPALAERTGVTVRYLPILLGGVFKATNNASPIQTFAGVAGKLPHQTRVIERFAERYQIPFAWNPAFPVNTLGLMRGAVYAQGKPWEAAYTDAMFDALWVTGQKMDDPQVIARVLSDAGLPDGEIMAGTQDPEVKSGLIAATEAAVARGVYGAPALFVGDEMFFGKDSLDELEWWLTK